MQIGLTLSTLLIAIISKFAKPNTDTLSCTDIFLSSTFILASAAAHLSSSLTLPLIPAIDAALLVPTRNIVLLCLWSLFTGGFGVLVGVWLPLGAVNLVGAAAAFEVELASFYQRPIAIPQSPTISYSSKLSPTSPSSPLAPATASRLHATIALLPFATFFLLLTPISPFQSPSRLQPICTYLDSPSLLCDTAQLGSIDIVVSYLNEEPRMAREMIDRVRSQHFTSLRNAQVVVYNKGGARSEELKWALGADEVVRLPSVGGEGGTVRTRASQTH